MDTNQTLEQDEYALIDLLPNSKEIKVFTVLGRTLKGKIINRKKGSILLLETQTNRQAYINLNHIISITGDV